MDLSNRDLIIGTVLDDGSTIVEIKPLPGQEIPYKILLVNPKFTHKYTIHGAIEKDEGMMLYGVHYITRFEDAFKEFEIRDNNEYVEGIWQKYVKPKH